jgi:hypothetical protein
MAMMVQEGHPKTVKGADLKARRGALAEPQRNTLSQLFGRLAIGKVINASVGPLDERTYGHNAEASLEHVDELLYSPGYRDMGMLPIRRFDVNQD